MSDTIIIEQILKRDKKALSIFYRTHTPKLTRFIRSKVDSREDGEEILQDTLFAFLEAIRDFNGTGTIDGFLFSICHHKIIDFYRRKKLKQIVFSRVPQLEELLLHASHPQNTTFDTSLKEKVHAVLSGLLPRYRHVLLLKYIDNLSVEEIARDLSITFKSAESILFRARKAFIRVFV